MQEEVYGVVRTWSGYNCNRCGNKQQQYFATFYDMYEEGEVTYCRKCVGIGQANTVDLLQRIKERKSITSDFCFCLPFSLRPEQQKALFYLRGHMQAGCTLLLQAVCGAGKTEIVAALIADALARGQYIGWAIARKDVVIELTARLRTYFPLTTIVGLYQYSPDLAKTGQLTVLTTARLYDFYRFFDVLIVDENDAFPFNIDEGQQFAARKAVVKDGMSVHISATVLSRQRRAYDYVRSLSRRFHDYDLPTIVFRKCRLFTPWKREGVNEKIRKYLNLWLGANCPVFIFVSNKELGRTFTQSLQTRYGKDAVTFVSSDIVDRTPILEAVRVGTVSILVTTTILERGVTFKGLQVIVLDADAALFDAQTLVQIAGRVGRNMNAPDGAIIFCYQKYVTPAMRTARKYHERANEGEVLFL